MWHIKTVRSTSILLCSVAYLINLFPVYNSLKVKSSKNVLEISKRANYLGFVLYFIISVLGVYNIGIKVDQNILNDIGKEKSIESIVLRIIFLLILSMHIPFVFFTSKESMLIIVDEYNRMSISKAL